jgi:lipopolysaccharide/colanic/teichoic acid biosynthesis glycosyltransferase
MNRSHQLVKRMVDVVGATAGLTLGAPLIATVAILVRQRLGSPILFRQQRPGKGGVAFEMIKFRTMLDARDSNGNPLPDRERLTPFGKWLRATSIDELPELWNVLRGEMSLVGPRPLLMKYLPLYSEIQARRHEVRPGITGWAQINGRNAIDWPSKFALDVWYVDNESLLLDFRILCKTVGAVFFKDGISAAGEATMPAFVGNNVNEPDSAVS